MHTRSGVVCVREASLFFLSVNPEQQIARIAT